jgi:hypothetical protein
MNMQRSCDETDRGKQQKYWQENLSQCHFAQYKCPMYGPGVEGGPPLFEADD